LRPVEPGPTGAAIRRFSVFDSVESITKPITDFVNNTLGPTADFLEEWVWKWPEEAPLLALILLGTGLFVTLRLALIQVRGFRHAIAITRGKYDDPNDEGDLKHFQALTTALSATVGIGNIAGVALAIRLGGPGALFWMWVTAFFGMALKYVECTLAMMHRRINPDGSASGGPMYYIELGLGRNWKWLAVTFAGFAAIASFGGGCMNQSNSLADQVQSQWGIPTVFTGLVFAALVAAVIIGGIRRIGRVTAVLAPSMALMYVAGAMIILAIHLTGIPAALALIFKQAFAPEPLIGGGVGSIIMTLMWGVRRGLFSNEAGQGSAPIAHATAKTKEPVREGLVASLGPFIDTLVICTMTGLVIIVTGAHLDKVEQELDLSAIEIVLAEGAGDDRLLDLRETREARGTTTVEVAGGRLVGGSLFFHDSAVEQAVFSGPDGDPWSGRLLIDGEEGSAEPEVGEPVLSGVALLNGAPLTGHAFEKGLGTFGSLIVTLAVILFAVSTGISWSYYGDRSVEYLFGPAAIPIYRWVFIFFFLVGAVLPLEAVWTYGDVALGLMTLPNLIGVFLLSGGVAAATREYFSREHKPYG
jgi:AGCS family alanine or glycine:cation symporter